MTEQLLQFVWQFQYFNKSDLFTSNGEALQIINCGTHNSNQGPDFLNAKIKIADTVFAGSIEIHINASEWNTHKHSADENYKNVILHVVWQEDKNLQLSFPSLELYSRVSNIMLEKYETLMNERQFIPCQKHIQQISEISFTAWKERLLIERLQEKATYVQQKLEKNNHHWEEVFWQLLAKNFGFKINSDAFENIATSVPLNILGKHKNQLHQLEAILMGQAGLLTQNFTDDYAVMLKKEYLFLKMKYSLADIHIPVYFLRMRPANFPTIRLSQLAMLVHKSHHLFSKIKEAETVKQVESLFDVQANDYWHYHYTFEEENTFKKKSLGKQMIHPAGVASAADR